MQVLVSGGSGRIGQVVMADLLAHGHTAVNADLRRPGDGGRGKGRFIETDLLDLGQVCGAMVGCNAVVHLGAIPYPDANPDEVVFNQNVRATFNVLQAAALLGVRRAAIASSLAALGTFYAKEPTYPLFAPVDESHPLLGQDPYALSKEVDEATAKMFHRRYGIQVAAMRFALVADEKTLRERAAALTKNPQDLMSRVLWSYVDVRDAAELLRLSLETEDLGCEAFLVSAADTLVDRPTEELIAEYTPSVRLSSPIVGTSTAICTDKAGRLLGWRPRHSWRGTSGTEDGNHD